MTGPHTILLTRPKKVPTSTGSNIHPLLFSSFFSFLEVLGMKPRTQYMLGKHYTTGQNHWPMFLLFFLIIKMTLSRVKQGIFIPNSFSPFSPPSKHFGPVLALHGSARFSHLTMTQLYVPMSTPSFTIHRPLEPRTRDYKDGRSQGSASHISRIKHCIYNFSWMKPTQ